MFDYFSLNEYQIKITAHYNAGCLHCPRNENDINLKDLCNFIEYSTKVNSNTVIEEINLYCNLDHA